jgi:hypothetical protein
VGAARSLARGSLALALSALAAGAGAQQLEAVGACRDGVPNGAYELYQADGRLRAVGAFAQGRRTGTFIFWTGDGARIGVIPYSDDVRSGTIALWYTTRGSGRELRPKSEAPYVDSKPHGVKRSWYRSGRPELEAGRRSGPGPKPARCWLTPKPGRWRRESSLATRRCTRHWTRWCRITAPAATEAPTPSPPELTSGRRHPIMTLP